MSAVETPVTGPQGRRARRRDKIEARKDEITKRFYPPEKLNAYARFIEIAGSGEPISVDDANAFLEIWVRDPLSVRRKAQKLIREAAGESKLSLTKYSRAKSCLETLGKGEIPTTSKEAKVGGENHSILHEQLVRAEKTEGLKSSGIVFETAIGVGIPFLGFQVGVGGEVSSKNPENGRREIDVFVAPGASAVLGGSPVWGINKRGVEKWISFAGLTKSEGHPHRKDQLKAKVSILETAAGVAVGEKTSGMTLEAPLFVVGGLAMLVGAHDIAGYINSLDPIERACIKTQVVVNVQDERLQELAARFLPYIPRLPKFPRKKKSRKN